jgi:hypothetical protein
VFDDLLTAFLRCVPVQRPRFHGLGVVPLVVICVGVGKTATVVFNDGEVQVSCGWSFCCASAAEG